MIKKALSSAKPPVPIISDFPDIVDAAPWARRLLDLITPARHLPRAQNRNRTRARRKRRGGGRDSRTLFGCACAVLRPAAGNPGHRAPVRRHYRARRRLL